MLVGIEFRDRSIYEFNHPPHHSTWCFCAVHTLHNCIMALGILLRTKTCNYHIPNGENKSQELPSSLNPQP